MASLFVRCPVCGLEAKRAGETCRSSIGETTCGWTIELFLSPPGPEYQRKLEAAKKCWQSAAATCPVCGLAGQTVGGVCQNRSQGYTCGWRMEVLADLPDPGYKDRLAEARRSWARANEPSPSPAPYQPESTGLPWLSVPGILIAAVGVSLLVLIMLYLNRQVSSPDKSSPPAEPAATSRQVVNPPPKTADSQPPAEAASGWTGSLSGHRSALDSIAVSPDGQSALTCDGNMRLWNLNNGARRWAWTENGLFSAGFTRDGRTIVALHRAPEEIVALDADSGRVIQRVPLEPLQNGYHQLAVLPDNETVLAVGYGKACLWNLRYARKLRELGDRSNNYSVAISPDGRLGVTGAWRNGVLLAWDLTSGRLLSTIDSQMPASAYSVAFTPDGRHFLAEMEKTITVWNADNFEKEKVLTGALFASGVSGLAVSPGGRWVVAAGSDLGLALWDLKWRDPSHPGGIAVIPALIPGGKLANWPAQARLFGTPITAVAFTPDGRRLVMGRRDGEVYVASFQQSWLGVEVSDHSDAEMGRAAGGEGRGLRIDRVHPGSPAATANLAPGSVILSVDGKRAPAEADFHLAIRRLPVRTPVRLRIFTNGAVGDAELVTANLLEND